MLADVIENHLVMDFWLLCLGFSIVDTSTMRAIS